MVVTVAVLLGLQVLGAGSERCFSRCSADDAQCTRGCTVNSCYKTCQQRNERCTTACANEQQADQSRAANARPARSMPCEQRPDGSLRPCTESELAKYRHIAKTYKGPGICRDEDGNPIGCPDKAAQGMKWLKEHRPAHEGICYDKEGNPRPCPDSRDQ